MATGPRFSGLNSNQGGVRRRYEKAGTARRNLEGIFLAKVAYNKDDTYQGHVWVEIIGHDRISEKEDDEEKRRFQKVRRCMPFGGYGHKQDGKFSIEYGMSTQPPAVGTQVIVAFTGRDQEGFLIGVVPDSGRNTQLPGMPANEIATDESATTPTAGPDDGLRGNSGSRPSTAILGQTYDAGVLQTDTTQKNVHPQQQFLVEQGLDNDSVRGLGSSGGRRESPSNVFGFKTMGGHSFVLDDGTKAPSDHTLTPASAREEGLNKHIRLRSKDGAQILFNDTWKMVYIINQKGTAWIQMSCDGDIDIFSANDINVRAENDINFYADRNFSVDADQILLNARGEPGIRIHADAGNIDIKSNAFDVNIEAVRDVHLRAGPNMRLTADLIDINGTPANFASSPSKRNQPGNKTITESINSRVPEHEPWGGHAEDPWLDKVAVQATIDLQRDLSDYQLPNPVISQAKKAPEVATGDAEDSGVGTKEMEIHACESEPTPADPPQGLVAGPRGD
jgi:hypothetical protein